MLKRRDSHQLVRRRKEVEKVPSSFPVREAHVIYGAENGAMRTESLGYAALSLFLAPCGATERSDGEDLAGSFLQLTFIPIKRAPTYQISTST